MTIASTEWELWSTRARLVVTNPGVLGAARELVDSYLAEVDDAANRFREDSEIRRLVGRSGWVTLSPTLTHLMAEALAAADLTDGDVDPTVGRARAAPRLRPRPAARAGRERAPCARSCSRSPGTAAWQLRGLPAPGARRGRARPRRHRQGGRRRPGGAPGPGRASAPVCSSASAATSPPRGRHRTPAGRSTSRTASRTPGPRSRCPAAPRSRPPAPSRGSGAAADATLHHVVDPRTGQPARPVWRSVTVAASTCAYANAVTTASLVRGERAVDWVRGLGLPARFLRSDGSLVLTDGWPRDEAA